MKALIILSQSIEKSSLLSEYLEGVDLVVAADGGADAIESIGISPDVLVGDFDSISQERLSALEATGIPVIRHPREKDETDGELAVLYALERGADSIVLLGALGGRVDHEMANLMLLTRPELRGKDAAIVAGRQVVRALHGGEELRIQGKQGDILSLIPVGGDARGITTSGLLYGLQNGDLLMGFARGVSNEFVSPKALVSLQEGTIFVVHISV